MKNVATLHSIASGLEDGPGLLLINGIGTTTRIWEPQLKLLEQFFKVVRYDIRGHGDSAPQADPCTMDAMVEDAFAVMDRHGLASARVMGCSLGSMIAIGMGLSQPERVSRVVCTGAGGPSPEPLCRDAIPSGSGQLEQADTDWEGALAHWLTPDFTAAHADTVSMLEAEFLKTAPQGYRDGNAALQASPCLKDLSQMKAPMLFIAGEKDQLAPPSQIRSLAEACPQGEFAVVQNAAHLVHVNQDTHFNLAICSFLDLCAA